MVQRQRKHPDVRRHANVVPLRTLAEPPDYLDGPERELWASIITEYVIDDSASLAVLAAGLEGRARARKLRQEIDRAGPTMPDRWKLLHAERCSHGLFLQALKQLRLDTAG